MPSLNDRLNGADPTVRAAPQPQPQVVPRPQNGQLMQQQQNLLAQLQGEQLMAMQMIGLIRQSLTQAMPDLNMVANEVLDQLRADGNQWILYEDQITITIEP